MEHFIDSLCARNQNFLNFTDMRDLNDLPEFDDDFDAFDDEDDFPMDDAGNYNPDEDDCGDEGENEMTILSALDYIQNKAHRSELKKSFWEKCERQFKFLCDRLGQNKNQVLITAILSETGANMSWRRIGNFLGVSRLKAMTFTDDVEDMKRRRLVVPGASFENGGRYDGIRLAPRTILAFRRNERFVPENLGNLTEQAFVDRLVRYVNNEGQDHDILKEDNHRWMMMLVDENLHLPLCEKVREIEDETSRILLLLAVVDYALYVNTPNHGLSLGELNKWFDGGWEFDSLADSLRDGKHELFSCSLIEHKCDDGLVDTECIVLTSQAVDELVGNYSPHKKKRDRSADRDLVAAKDIVEKQMYYNDKEQCQIGRLRSLLSEEGLAQVHERLASVGMRKGIACLFYGAPGTGKTETVLQIARETGRDIMQVNIAGLRDKFVGESEKNIKGIFDRYKALCQGRALTPILFFNEADALINTRLERTQSSVEKMDNAIQNILLQEMENLEGIMIATTNLTGTLDKAFDRRFLFKVEFDKPGTEVKQSIWHSMLPGLDEDACSSLAREFDFSGGQIENIARKSNIEHVLSGKEITLEYVRTFCREEYINRSSRPRMGF